MSDSDADTGLAGLLQHTTDGGLWAEVFCQRHNVGTDDDLGLMTDWFANALQTGLNKGREW